MENRVVGYWSGSEPAPVWRINAANWALAAASGVWLCAGLFLHGLAAGGSFINLWGLAAVALGVPLTVGQLMLASASLRQGDRQRDIALFSVAVLSVAWISAGVILLLA